MPVVPRRPGVWAAPFGIILRPGGPAARRPNRPGDRTGFVQLSGDRWGEARIASGNDEAEARAMAGRTIAGYTGSSGEPSG